MITTVLMDYDGTLHDWDSVLHRILDGILGYSGKEFLRIWTHEIHRALVHTKYIDRHDDLMFHCQLLFEHLGLPFEKDTADMICHGFDEAIWMARNNPTYFPDALLSLDAMRERGLKLCLSTGTGAEVKAETLKKTTGKEYFEHIFSEPTIGHFKTEPEYYRIAMERAGSRPEETVSIGDTPLSDIRPAKISGIKTIWLNRDGEPEPPTCDQEADYVVKDLFEALRILDA